MGRLLIGYDGSPPSRRALAHAQARALAGKHELIVLTILPPTAPRSSLAGMMPAGIVLPSQMEGTFQDHAQERLDEVVKELESAGVPAKGVLRLGEPASSLLAAVTELGVDEVVIGHKSYQSGQVLGPNAGQIVRGCTVPVTVVP